MMNTFLDERPCLYSHVSALLGSEHEYLRLLDVLLTSKSATDLSHATKASVFAALCICDQLGHAARFVSACDIVDLSKGVGLLDCPRKVRQLTKKIHEIEAKHPHLNDTTEISSNDGTIREGKRRKRGIDRLRGTLKALTNALCPDHDKLSCSEAHKDTKVAELIASSSVSGALAKNICSWLKSHDEINNQSFLLNVLLLNMPLNHWKALADVIHPSPTDFQVPYFLSMVHGEEPPSDSLVSSVKEMLAHKGPELASAFNCLAEKHPSIYNFYSFLRTHKNIMSNKDIVEDLARCVPLSQAIWYLEELASTSSQAPSIVGERLVKEEWMGEDSKVTNSFAKLVERILTFRQRGWPLADTMQEAASDVLERLKTKSGDMKDSILVIGDASSSMETAIKSAAILAAMIAAVWEAEICFFHTTFQASPHPRPTSVGHVLDICSKIRAQGCTCHAAALWPYYNAKTKFDHIYCVTDQFENSGCNGYNFSSLMKKYKEFVNPNVKLTLITVDSGSASFRRGLSENEIVFDELRIDGRRPDLTKFDSMLNHLSIQSSSSVVDEDSEFVLL